MMYSYLMTNWLSVPIFRQILKTHLSYIFQKNYVILCQQIPHLFNHLIAYYLQSINKFNYYETTFNGIPENFRNGNSIDIYDDSRWYQLFIGGFFKFNEKLKRVNRCMTVIEYIFCSWCSTSWYVCMMICFSFNFEAADGAFKVFIAAIVVSFAMLFYTWKMPFTQWAMYGLFAGVSTVHMRFLYINTKFWCDELSLQ